MTDERTDTWTAAPIDAWIDDAARDRVVVTGPDAASYLQSQLAQQVADLAVGERRWTLVLEPAGKVVALARVARAGDDEYVLDTDAGFGDLLAARLARFKIRVAADLVVEAAAVATPSDAHEQARIEAGWPRMGHEIVPGETIPATTGVVDVAVNFTKGCYPGQELVERMDSRGADAPWRLRVLEVAAGAQAGDPVVEDDREVGVLTSVAPSGTVAIARVRRSR